MASPGYLTIIDGQNEKIKANVVIQGREGTAEVHAFDYHVCIPSDATTGALTSIRKHGDAIITKNFDSASPILFHTCCSGSTLKTVQLDWYRINDQGQEENYYTHLLSDVKVVQVKHFMLHVKDHKTDGYGHQEQIHLRFRRIEMKYHQGNINAVDDWVASRSKQK